MRSVQNLVPLSLCLFQRAKKSPLNNIINTFRIRTTISCKQIGHGNHRRTLHNLLWCYITTIALHRMIYIDDDVIFSNRKNLTMDTISKCQDTIDRIHRKNLAVFITQQPFFIRDVGPFIKCHLFLFCLCSFGKWIGDRFSLDFLLVPFLRQRTCFAGNFIFYKNANVDKLRLVQTLTNFIRE